MKSMFVFILNGLLLVTPVFADNGTSTSYTSVTTNIQGSGSTTTHIQSTVNGHTETLDSSSPGTYTLTNNSDGTVTKTQTGELTPLPTAVSATPTVTPHTTLHTKKPLHVSYTFFDSLKKFFQQIFHLH